MLTRLVKDHGYPSVCRRSVIESEAFKQALTLNGQDVASLYLKVLETRRRQRLHEIPHRAGVPAGR